MTIWLWNISPRLHLHWMTQPFEYEFTLEPNDHMIMENLPETSPAPDDSTIRIRVHLRTKWPYDYEKCPRDFTCTRWFNNSDTSLPKDQMTIWLRQIFPRLHLHPMTQPFEYELNLWLCFTRSSFRPVARRGCRIHTVGLPLEDQAL